MRLARIGLSLAAVGALVAGVTVGTAPVANADVCLPPLCTGPPTPPSSNACLPTLFTVAGSRERDVSGTGGDERSTVDAVARGWLDHYGGSGHAAVVPINYPAVSPFAYVNVAGVLKRVGLGGLGSILGAVTGTGTDAVNGLEPSEKMGEDRLVQALVKRYSDCPRVAENGSFGNGPRIAIAGYSQGADVASRAVNRSEVRSKGYYTPIALLGNPSYLFGPSNACERDVDRRLRNGDLQGDGSRNNGTGAQNGTLRGIRPSLGQTTYNACLETDGVQPDYIPLNYCIFGDAICNYRVTNAALLATPNTPHYFYASSGLAFQAGEDLGRLVDDVFFACC